MAKKSGNFFEQNIDKIVLAFVGLASMAILVLMVVRSPNTIVVDNKSYGPGEIDSAISNKASQVSTKLSAPAKPHTYTSQFDEFKTAYASSVKNIPQDSMFPVPVPLREVPPNYVGPYSEPKIGQLGKDVVAGVVSGVAGVPLGPTLESGTEPRDVDLVTVQCTLNSSVIYREMNRCFGNERELNQPVFAAVDLQRQEMGADGAWPDDIWQSVKRTKIDPYGDILDVGKIMSAPISEAESLRAQLRTLPVAIDVLQPVEYTFQSRADRWLLPALEIKREQLRSRITNTPGVGVATEGAPAVSPGTRQPPRPGRPGSTTGSEGETAGRPGGRPGPGARPAPTNPRPGMGSPGAVPPGMAPGGPSGEGTGTSTPETEFDALRIVNVELLKDKQQVTFWAHDDTVEPGKTYRYRMRVGILNPIAGRGRSTTDPALADKLVFWSDLTKETQAVDISARMYLFPMKLRETDNMVTIEVAKYNMARWDKKQYDIKAGEVIGHPEKIMVADPCSQAAGSFDVDFTTGITLIDVETVTEYRANSPTPLTYQQILYRGQDGIIRHLAIKSSSWPKSLKKKSNDIVAAMRAQPALPANYTSSTPTYSSPSTPSGPMPSGPGGMREE
jgi:hypothetical protein